MAFNKLYKHVEGLVTNDEEVADSVPCKADILGVRECRKGGKVRETEKDIGNKQLRRMKTDLNVAFPFVI